MHVEHPLAGDGPGVPPSMVDVQGERAPVDDGVFAVPDDADGWLRAFAAAYDAAPDELVREEDGPPDGRSPMHVDPGDHAVADLRDLLSERDYSDDALQAMLEQERDGKDRTTAKGAIESAMDGDAED